MNGGSYKYDPKSGERVLVKEPTKNHPKGNRARLTNEKNAPLKPAKKTRSDKAGQ